MQEVLHVQSVDSVFGIVLDDLVRNEEGLVGVVRSKAVHGETTGQASDGAEQAFESLGQVMRDKVLIHLW